MGRQDSFGGKRKAEESQRRCSVAQVIWRNSCIRVRVYWSHISSYECSTVLKEEKPAGRVSSKNLGRMLCNDLMQIMASFPGRWQTFFSRLVAHLAFGQLPCAVSELSLPSVQWLITCCGELLQVGNGHARLGFAATNDRLPFCEGGMRDAGQRHSADAGKEKSGQRLTWVSSVESHQSKVRPSTFPTETRDPSPCLYNGDDVTFLAQPSKLCILSLRLVHKSQSFANTGQDDIGHLYDRFGQLNIEPILFRRPCAQKDARNRRIAVEKGHISGWGGGRGWEWKLVIYKG